MISNTHLLGEVSNTTGGKLKQQRISDIQDVIEDKFSGVNGDTDDATILGESKEQKSEDNQDLEQEKAKEISAKKHAKSEPPKIFGINVWWIVGATALTIVTVATVKYFKNKE